VQDLVNIHEDRPNDQYYTCLEITRK